MHHHSGLGVGCTNDGMNLTFSGVDERTDVTARIRYHSLLVRQPLKFIPVLLASGKNYYPISEAISEVLPTLLFRYKGLDVT